MNLSRLRFCAVAVSRTSSLAPRPAQASQSQPVELEDSLHMRKLHLDLFALPA